MGRRHGPAADAARDAAVSSTIGTVLMLAITITVFAGISVGVLSYFRSQPQAPHVEIDVVAQGDNYLLVHKGGEDVPLADGSIIVNVGGTPQTIRVADLRAAGYLNGEFWRTGQSVCLAGPSTPSRTCYIDTAVNADPDIRGSAVILNSHTVAFNGVLNGGTPRGSCVSDAQAPTVSAWLQSPSDVGTLTTGAVTVTIDVVDNCIGPSATVAPHLYWRINDGSSPAFLDAGASTSAGTARWRASLPAQAWSTLSGKTLEYYMSPLQDTNGNSGNSPVQADIIEVPGTVYTYVSSATMVTGAVSSFFNAQSSSDGGASAAVAEGPVTAVLEADGVNAAHTNPSWLSPVLASGSDDQWATEQTQADLLQLTLASPPGPGGAITALRLSAEVSVLGQSGSDGFTLRACFDALCGTESGTLSPGSTDTTVSFDATAARPGGGSWRWADLAGLEVRLSPVRANPSGETWRVDHASATVTYAPVAATLAPDGVTSFVSWSDATLGYTSDNAYATYAVNTASPSYLQYTLADPATATGSITSVVLNAEVSITGRVDDGFSLQACIVATCSTASTALAASATDTTITYDVTALRPGGGSWAWADVNGLESRITPVRAGAKDGTWRIDSAWVMVTYTFSKDAGSSNSPSSWNQPNRGYTSNNLYATTTATTPIQYVIDDPPALTGTVALVGLGAEVSVSGHIDDAFTVQACLAATCSAASPQGGASSADTLTSFDVTALRPGGGAWSLADLSALEVRVNPVQNGAGRDGTWQVDQVYATFTIVQSMAATGEASAVSWSGWDKAAASDNQYATYARNDNPPPHIQFSLTAPASSSSHPVTQVVLKAELAIVGQSNDDMTLQACFALTCSSASADLGITGIDAVVSYDVTSLRPGGGAWSWSDLSNLDVRVNPVLRTARDGTWEVDRVWVEVSSPAYTMDGRLGFSGVPAGTTHGLQMAYRVTGDAFTVQLWDGASWTTRGAPLDATVLTPWSYALTPAEYNGGAPILRLLDATPNGPDQGVVYLDYARVSTP